MSRSLILLSAAAFAAAGCAGNGWARMEEEFPEVRANCRLSGTYLERDSRDPRLLRLLFRQRNAEEVEASADGRLACAEHWARERGWRLTTVPAGIDSPVPPSAWTVDCHAGEDGFAHNCEAVRTAGDYVLRLASADAQVFVTILHPRCETAYRNFDRTDLVGLVPAERRALIERAFHEIEGEIRRTCPTLAPPAPALNGMPDIAILSPETRS